MSTLPAFGIVQGRGRCRVLSYSNNRFELLTGRDERLHVHRDRIAFTNRGASLMTEQPEQLPPPLWAWASDLPAGRCSSCQFHIATQGHHPACSEGK